MTDSQADTLSALQQFELPGSLYFESDDHGLIRAQVTTASCEATIYLHGAHVTHWQPSGEKPVLFLSGSSEFAPGQPIRGGIPIIFPWFGPKADDATAPAHGWARRQEWQVEASREIEGGVELVLCLDSTQVAQAKHNCFLRYRVRAGATLQIELEVENRDDSPLLFEEALHTYFTVGDIHGVTVEGLAGTPYMDKVGGATQKKQGDEPLRFTGETDRIYIPTTSTVTILDQSLERKLIIEKSASEATVVWNPWIAKAAAMPDFGDDEWPHMLCIETANVAGSAIHLARGAKHIMAATFKVTH